MGGRIRIAEPSRIDASVDLRGRNGSVTEQLLDRAQVRPALQQMRGKAVAQGVRRYPSGERRLAHPQPEPPGDVRVGESPAALGEEQRLLARVGAQRVAATLAVAAQGPLRR